MSTYGAVRVIGEIWQPGAGLCAMSYTLTPYDVENLRNMDERQGISRGDIQDWLAMNAGDFSRIQDFEAEIGALRYGWKDEDSECVYVDAMYGEED